MDLPEYSIAKVLSSEEVCKREAINDKNKAICELEEKQNFDLGHRYKNDHSCVTSGQFCTRGSDPLPSQLEDFQAMFATLADISLKSKHYT